MNNRGSVPVTERALVQRINRVLAKQDEVLKAARGERAVVDLGRYYVLSVSGNYVVDKDVDLEDLGRALEALKPFEVLA